MKFYVDFVVLTFVLTRAMPCYAIDGGGILLLVGGQQTNLQKLDQSLTNQDLSPIGSTKTTTTNLTTVGGEIFRYSAGLMIGIEGHGIIPRSSEASEGVVSSFSGGYGLINAGPAYSSDSGFIFSPGIGVGWGQMDLKFEHGKNLKDVLPSDTSSDDPSATTSRNKSTNLTNKYGIVDGHLEILFGRDKGGFAFGVRGGYLHAIDGGTWRTSRGDEIIDVPPSPIRGAYIRLSLGYGVF